MWEHSQDFLVPCFMRTRSTIVNIIFLYAPPCCQDVSYKKCWRTPPMGVGWSPRSQLIKQDWYKYCSVLRAFRPSPPLYIYNYLLHLFDRYFLWVDKHIFWYRLIDLRNSKNPTYAHTHTTHQTSLPSCQQFLGELNQSLGLEPFRINQNNINPPIYPLFVARRSIARGKVQRLATAHSMHSIFWGALMVWTRCM